MQGPHTKFVLHINFGNEELTSAIRIKLLVPEELVPCLKWINNQNLFSFKQVKKYVLLLLKQSQLLKICKEHHWNIQEKRLIRIVRVLTFNGLLNEWKAEEESIRKNDF